MFDDADAFVAQHVHNLSESGLLDDLMHALLGRRAGWEDFGLASRGSQGISRVRKSEAHALSPHGTMARKPVTLIGGC